MEDGDGVHKEEIGKVKRGSKGKERGKRGDFNARMGEGGALEDGEKGKRRVSKDKGINEQGAELVKWEARKRWGIMNGAKEGG